MASLTEQLPPNQTLRPAAAHQDAEAYSRTLPSPQKPKREFSNVCSQFDKPARLMFSVRLRPPSLSCESTLLRLTRSVAHLSRIRFRNRRSSMRGINSSRSICRYDSEAYRDTQSVVPV